jgi:hypothetical protein
MLQSKKMLGEKMRRRHIVPIATMIAVFSLGILLTSCQSSQTNNKIQAPSEGEGDISKDQGQFWTSNQYLVTEDGSVANAVNTAFGVNQATGHIKGYPSDESGPMAKHVRAVSGSIYGTEYTYTDSDSTSSKKNQAIEATSSDTYLDNGDGTITDTSTGLMWLASDAGVAMEWKEALSWSEDLDYAGYTDWHLPDVKELQSLVDYAGSYPAIDNTYFTCTELAQDNPNYYFWTSTSAYFSPADPTYYYAWYVAFGFAIGDDGDSHGAGAVRFSPKYEESTAFCEGGDNMTNSVRAVRIDERYYDAALSKVVTTGQTSSYDGDGKVVEPAVGDAYYGQDALYASPDLSYTDNGDGTVTDNNTGLIWQIVPSDDHMSIDEATEYCENLELGGRTDWRLPTAEELFSLNDFEAGWPYIDTEYFQFPAASNFVPPQGSGPQGGPSGGMSGGPQG